MRRAVLRGCAVAMPPLLTIVILLWIGQAVSRYIVSPATAVAKHGLVWAMADVRTSAPQNEAWRQLASGEYVPEHVAARVEEVDGALPAKGNAVYARYIETTYLHPAFTAPLLIIGFLLLMYVLGRFLATIVERAVARPIERLIARLPLVRQVYGSVKQVVDLMLARRRQRVLRAAAIEYPGHGRWTIGFVTGEGMNDVSHRAGSETVSMLMPTYPMPMVGRTVIVPARDVRDLSLTIDQACQFIMSCGVIAPPEYLEPKKAIEGEPRP